MRIFDLFCGAGGAAEGYHRAGFIPVGVDINPQPHYPFAFVQDDALRSLKSLLTGALDMFDAIHASPPCQIHSAMTKRWGQARVESHQDLIGATRELLKQSGKPYIIENVVGARAYMVNPIMLCGTMFGLQTKDGNQLLRHRLFECSWDFKHDLICHHNDGSAIGLPSVGVYGNSGGSSTRDGKTFFGIAARKEVMGIDWMTGKELNQAIPPAYTEFIGKHLMQAITSETVEEGTHE